MPKKKKKKRIKKNIRLDRGCPSCGKNESHFIPPSCGDPGMFTCERTEPLTFKGWYRKLLMSSIGSMKIGLDHPLGACCYRDVLRDKDVVAAMSKAWIRIIEQ